ncbi:unnamed protein product [Oikopleura dioica]|uniref:NEDD8-conjugating enzyme UBC12 n=1 Tax=Oikopleura dioica TaxID=34765 RepID=E4YJF1_OIKDI|nr:unnamed protein product [Oikopleura dioica]
MLERGVGSALFDLSEKYLDVCPTESGAELIFLKRRVSLVKCETQVYHPNIDLDGNVCLNILREDWKPVLNINSVIYGLQFLFLEPNPDDPLNKEAADVLKRDKRQFEQNVYRSMRGGYIGNTHFRSCLK